MNEDFPQDSAITGATYFINKKYEVEFTENIVGDAWRKAGFEITWTYRNRWTGETEERSKLIYYSVPQISYLLFRVGTSMLATGGVVRRKRFQMLARKEGQLLKAMGHLLESAPTLH